MIDGTRVPQPPKLQGKPAIDPNVPSGLAPFNPGPPPNPQRDQKNQLEAQIRQIESTGGNASQLRAQLASVYDQMSPNWRASMPQQPTPVPGPAFAGKFATAPPINIDEVPLRSDQYLNADGSLNPAAIPTVSGNKVNTGSTLMAGISKMFQGEEHDTLDNLAYKIEGMRDVKSKVVPLLKNPNEAMDTLMALMTQFGGVKPPSQTLGAEEKAYIEQAFQVAPGRKFATIDDIPDNYINFALGYGLVGMFQGNGLRGFTDAAGAGLANAQQGFDQTFAQETAEFESKKALNIALANRAGKIADNNFQQEGFYAKDMRDIAEKVTMATMNLDKQTQLAALSTILPMLQNLDSDRYPAFVATMGPLLKEKFNITLPELLPKTSKEAETDKKIESLGLKDDRLKQIMRFAEDLQPLLFEKLSTEVSILAGKDEEATIRLEILGKELKGWDKKRAAELLLIGVRTETLKTQAKAALLKAQADNKPLPDAKMKQLQAMSGVTSSTITQLAKQQAALSKQLDTDRKALEGMNKEMAYAKPSKERIITLDAAIKQISARIGKSEGALTDLDTQVKTISDSQSAAATALAKELGLDKK